MSNRRKKQDIVRTEKVHGHDIHFYRQQIASGEVLEVPTFVVRNDALRGWQIRIARKLIGYHSQFVPDDKNGGTPSLSLDIAVRKMKALIGRLDMRRVSALKGKEKSRKRVKLGVPGATVRWLLNKKRGIYELRISVRAGGGERKSARFMKMVYVGTEMSVTEERIRHKLHEVAGIRRRWVADHATIYSELPGVQRGRGSGRISYDLAAIEAALEEAKQKHEELLTQLVLSRVDDAMRGPETLQSWRGVSLKRKSILKGSKRIRVPWFVDLVDDVWVYTFPLPDGSVYGDELKVSGSFDADMRAILFDCMMTSARTTRPIPRETLW